MFGPVDWNSVFSFDTPLLEIFVRGSLIYLSMFVILRVVLKRESGTVALSDLLVIVLIADASQNGMAGNYQSVPDGVLLVSVIIFWAYLLDWLGYRFPAVGKFLHPPPLLLVRDGRLIRGNMRKEFITHAELMTMLREEGVSDLNEVRRAYLEGDGKISVITREASKGSHHSDEDSNV